MSDTTLPIKHIGIVGAGAMGTGIAQVSASGHIQATLFDTRQGAAQAACEQITARLRKRANEGKMPSDEAEAIIARLHAANHLEDLAQCDLIVEAIVEDIEAKLAVFTELEKLVSPNTILASNTSSIPIGAIAAGCQHRTRIAGMHFFNPVPLMKLVEIIPGPDTSSAVLETLISAGKCMGRTPVVVKDMPGFLVNYGGRAYTTEGMALEHEGVASPAQIDAIMRDAFGFRMGPFELADLTGIDVNFPVSEFIHRCFFSDARLRSTPRHRYMLETGQLGRKTGRGFYSYAPDASRPSPDAQSQATAANQVYVAQANPVLAALLDEAGITPLDQDDGNCPILIAPVGLDCSASVVQLNLQSAAARVVAIDTLGNTDVRITLMKSPATQAASLDALVSAFSKHRKVTVINDSPGFVGPRIAAMVANLGCEMAQTGVASPDDIDNAMRLGLNYPRGPLELCDYLGVNTVFTILSSIQSLTGDDRYRPSQWLRRRAQLSLSAHITS